MPLIYWICIGAGCLLFLGVCLYMALREDVSAAVRRRINDE